MQKRWEHIEYDITEATELQQQLHINPVFCQLLVQRGIRTYEAAKRFFRPQLAHLHDPFLMKDMEKAVRRIAEAVIKKQKILIYGDYDVDGTTAVALVYTFLKPFHEQLIYYIPDRYKEGYGISTKGIDYAHQQDCALILALDCGIKAYEAIRMANEKAIDVIVCDHHLPDATLPEAYAILNPKQSDCSYPYKELSGCAIGFKLVEAFAQLYNISFEEKVAPLLDLVAISLACDFVPLTGENRVLASFGLQLVNKPQRIGIQTLQTALNKNTHYTIRDLVFGIGPHINAAGRMEHARLAVELFIAPTETAANQLVEKLIDLNQQRREIEKAMLEEAVAMIENDVLLGEKKAIILFKNDWHKGVIGILASKIVDLYHKPTIILTESNGRLVGSARSVADFNLYKAIDACKDLFINYGGHAFAAGLSLKIANFNPFKQQFQQIVAEQIKSHQEQAIIYVDSPLKLADINDKFWQLLQQFAPFGPQNMRPIFSSKPIQDTGYSKSIKERHIKLVVRQQNSAPIEGIAFNLGQHMDNITAKKHFELCYVLEENTFKGQSKLQLNVKDIRFV